MTQIEDNINALLKKIKEDESLVDYTFVNGFGASDHEYPLKGYLIAVSTLDQQVGKEFLGNRLSDNLTGSIYNCTLKFRLYAPKSAGGEGLSSLAYTLTQAIKKCDTQSVCESINATPINFDTDMMTVYRDVIAELSFCVYEEVPV